MIINRIFINKKTGNLILIYCTWKQEYLEIYNQFKNKTERLKLYATFSIVPIIQYVKTQLNANWIRAKKLITLENNREKIRLFSFRNNCYIQKFDKGYSIPKRGVIITHKVYVGNSSDLLEKYEDLSYKNHYYDKYNNIQTGEYINIHILLKIIEDL